jgi:hypothetical protein
MFSQKINSEEILAFQNEFIEIIQYFKRFMNLVMKRVRDTDTEYTLKKSKIKSKISDLKNYIKRLQDQKADLYNLLLAQ